MHGDVSEVRSVVCGNSSEVHWSLQNVSSVHRRLVVFLVIRVVLLFRSVLIKGNVAAPCACAAYVRMKKNYLYMHVRGSCEQFEEHR